MQLKLRKLFLTILTFFLFTVFNIGTASAGTQYTYDANGNRIILVIFGVWLIVRYKQFAKDIAGFWDRRNVHYSFLSEKSLRISCMLGGISAVIIGMLSMLGYEVSCFY